jgi:hypothetical protein
MTPLKLDNYIRCVKRNGGEEWFAYSVVVEAWFPLPAKEAEWILSMLHGVDTEQTMAHCRANCYKDVGCDTEGVLFEK